MKLKAKASKRNCGRPEVGGSSGHVSLYYLPSNLSITPYVAVSCIPGSIIGNGCKFSWNRYNVKLWSRK
jgi:hypothetical protein